MSVVVLYRWDHTCFTGIMELYIASSLLVDTSQTLLSESKTTIPVLLDMVGVIKPFVSFMMNGLWRSLQWHVFGCFLNLKGRNWISIRIVVVPELVLLS